MNSYFAVCTKGIEPILATELSSLGAVNVTPTFGGVNFEADKESLYRICLWARTPSRILQVLRTFSAKNPAMLYDQVRRVKWTSLFTPDDTIAVECKMKETTDTIRNTHFAALKIKDAICDEMMRHFDARPSVDVANPDFSIFAYIAEGRCTLSLDVIGGSLHERGYRKSDSGAPLKETLAAAIVLLSGWKSKQVSFMDPMCGSGTLVLEAAMQAYNIAPGLSRKRFGFERWRDFDSTLFKNVVDQALESEVEKIPYHIVGFDSSRKAIAGAIDNAHYAELEKKVHFERREIDDLEPLMKSEKGTLVVNPPYGIRLGEEQEIALLYKKLGDLFKQRMKGWDCYIFTGNRDAAKSIGLRPKRRIPLFNGPIECRLLEFPMH